MTSRNEACCRPQHRQFSSAYSGASDAALGCLFVARHARVDPMKLPESDLLDAELPETALGLRNQIGGASVGRPLVRPRARKPALVAISSPS